VTSHGFYHLANRGGNVIGCPQLHIVLRLNDHLLAVGGKQRPV